MNIWIYLSGLINFNLKNFRLNLLIKFLIDNTGKSSLQMAMASIRVCSLYIGHASINIY